MTFQTATLATPGTTREPPTGARDLYTALLREPAGSPGETAQAVRVASEAFLRERLAAAALLPWDLPADPTGLETWMEASHRETADAYQAYLVERRAGAPRRYFPTRSHALHLLKAVAPTKLVDGAWLYGLLRHAQDTRLAPLIRTYLEELGDGRPEQNHVVIYRKLLEEHGIEGWERLSDAHHTQGAIQLALAHHADTFLPEIIGFNLGYEQLPLHLLITSHELEEVGIDPTYFRLHVTVDNASTGHAKKAIDAVLAAMPRLGDAAAFYRRVVTGYRLNMLGMGTVDAIAHADLDAELVDMLERKGTLAAPLHGSACKVAGRGVGDWLGERGQIPAFLAELEKMGWIRRHRDPTESRFWLLIEGDRAPMFGAFSPYERQLVHDWIAGDTAAGRVRRLPRPRLEATPSGAPADPTGDVGAEARQLRRRLAEVGTGDAAMRFLASWMSPAHHHTPIGLLATRLYTERFVRPS